MFRGTAHIAKNVAQVDEKDFYLFDLLNDYLLLASRGFCESHKVGNEERISTIFNHIIKNHQREFKLEEAAELANMNPSAICRYIKKPPPKRFQKC